MIGLPPAQPQGEVRERGAGIVAERPRERALRQRAQQLSAGRVAAGGAGAERRGVGPMVEKVGELFGDQGASLGGARVPGGDYVGPGAQLQGVAATVEAPQETVARGL